MARLSRMISGSTSVKALKALKAQDLFGLSQLSQFFCLEQSWRVENNMSTLEQCGCEHRTASSTQKKAPVHQPSDQNKDRSTWNTQCKTKADPASLGIDQRPSGVVSCHASDLAVAKAVFNSSILASANGSGIKSPIKKLTPLGSQVPSEQHNCHSNSSCQSISPEILARLIASLKVCHSCLFLWSTGFHLLASLPGSHHCSYILKYKVIKNMWDK